MADHLTDKEAREIWCLAQLREALGDPLGRLMQDELVAHAAGVVAERDRLRADVRELVTGLAWITDHYTQLVNSGDAGNWDPEEEPEVATARALLAKHNPLQALADNARDMGLSYEGESDGK